jgi:excisionase family DNA binding protein
MAPNTSAADAVVEDGFASIEEAHKFLHISRASLYRLMESRQLVYAKFGRCRRIPWRALKDYAARCLVGTGE